MGRRGRDMFVIEDALHAEPIGEFGSRIHALNELHRLAKLPWDEAPNICPCARWQTCARSYHLIEYDTSSTPWKLISHLPVLEVSAKGISWASDDEK